MDNNIGNANSKPRSQEPQKAKQQLLDLLWGHKHGGLDNTQAILDLFAAPVQQEAKPIDGLTDREAALCDLEWANGFRAGWMACGRNDEKALAASWERSKEARQVLKAAPPQAEAHPGSHPGSQAEAQSKPKEALQALTDQAQELDMGYGQSKEGGEA